MRRALVIDDDPATRELLVELVHAEGYAVAAAASLAEARAALALQPPSVILADLVLPDGSGIAFIQELDPATRPPVVLMTGHASLDTSIDALRLGATDYLVKPVDIGRLQRILADVTPATQARADQAAGAVAVDRAGVRTAADRFGPLIGASVAMRGVYDQIARVAPTSVPVFVAGESGTGKELVAQSIHELSRRAARPFLAVNCGAIAPQLIESEMFGHEKGSFTGATRQHRGYFEAAHGGTLFLDEITEMAPDLQVKLLRVLETGHFMRVGSQVPLRSDVRIVAATNRVASEAVAEGKLRADLMYRLRVFPIALPALRERPEDIDLLAAHFLAELNREEARDKRFAPEALLMMRRYGWPGNVRELRNVVHQAFILADDLIVPACLPAELGAERRDAGPFITVRVGSRISDVERRLIFATLDQCKGSKVLAAEALGVSVKTLYNRLHEYGAIGDAAAAEATGTDGP
ncbi:MAG: sigma-54 dependent transcriptional regulator [Steroidobacteraceae bacterium]|jgi:DNA-binding NtrC family response regulator|nr:sigma-54 dependent transcriptional regulator [Steroidobacteraceae bacterium]